MVVIVNSSFVNISGDKNYTQANFKIGRRRCGASRGRLCDSTAFLFSVLLRLNEKAKVSSERTNRNCLLRTRWYNFLLCTPSRRSWEPQCTALQTDGRTDGRQGMMPVAAYTVRSAKIYKSEVSNLDESGHITWRQRWYCGRRRVRTAYSK